MIIERHFAGEDVRQLANNDPPSFASTSGHLYVYNSSDGAFTCSDCTGGASPGSQGTA